MDAASPFNRERVQPSGRSPLGAFNPSRSVRDQHQQAGGGGEQHQHGEVELPAGLALYGGAGQRRARRKAHRLVGGLGGQAGDGRGDKIERTGFGDMELAGRAEADAGELLCRPDSTMTCAVPNDVRRRTGSRRAAFGLLCRGRGTRFRGPQQQLFEGFSKLIRSPAMAFLADSLVPRQAVRDHRGHAEGARAESAGPRRSSAFGAASRISTRRTTSRRRRSTRSAAARPSTPPVSGIPPLREAIAASSSARTASTTSRRRRSSAPAASRSSTTPSWRP